MLFACIRDEAVGLYGTLIQSKNTGRTGQVEESGPLMEVDGQSVETILAEVLVGEIHR